MSRQAPIMVKCEVVDLSIAASKKMPDEIEVEASGDFRIHDGDERPTGLEGLIELRGMDDTYYSVSMRVQAAFSFADDWNKESRRAYLASGRRRPGLRFRAELPRASHSVLPARVDKDTAHLAER